MIISEINHEHAEADPDFELDLINDINFDATIQSMVNFKHEFNPSGDKLPLLFTPNVDDVVKLNEKQYSDLAAILKGVIILFLMANR